MKCKGLSLVESVDRALKLPPFGLYCLSHDFQVILDTLAKAFEKPSFQENASPTIHLHQKTEAFGSPSRQQRPFNENRMHEYPFSCSSSLMDDLGHQRISWTFCTHLPPCSQSICLRSLIRHVPMEPSRMCPALLYLSAPQIQPTSDRSESLLHGVSRDFVFSQTSACPQSKKLGFEDLQTKGPRFSTQKPNFQPCRGQSCPFSHLSASGPRQATDTFTSISAHKTRTFHPLN